MTKFRVNLSSDTAVVLLGVRGDSVEAWQWVRAMLAVHSQALHPAARAVLPAHEAGPCSCHRSCSFPFGDRLCHLWNIMTAVTLWTFLLKELLNIVWKMDALPTRADVLGRVSVCVTGQQ